MAVAVPMHYPCSVALASALQDNTNDSFYPDDIVPLAPNTVVRMIDGEYGLLQAPSATFIGLLQVLGSFGNSAVLLVYLNKKKKISQNYFMMSLAVVDLVTCLLVHPYVLSKLLHFYSPERLTCKLFEFCVHASLSVQTGLLSAVALDRYFAICHPLRFAAAYHRFMVLTALAVLFGVGLSLPIVEFYGERSVDLYLCNRVWRVYMCHYSDRYDRSSQQLVFSLIVVAALIFAVSSMAVLYACVAYTVFKRNRRVGPAFPDQAAVPGPSSHHDITSQPSPGRMQNTGPTGLEVAENEHRKCSFTSASGLLTLSPATTRGSVYRKEAHALPSAVPVVGCGGPNGNLTMDLLLPPTRLVTVSHNRHIASDLHIGGIRRRRRTCWLSWRGNVIMVTVTVVFLFSWAPFWVLRGVNFSHMMTEEDQTDSPLYTFLNHLYYLNNAINPLIYAFTVPAFRTDAKKLIRTIRRWCS